MLSIGTNMFKVIPELNAMFLPVRAISYLLQEDNLISGCFCVMRCALLYLKFYPYWSVPWKI